MEVRCIWAGPSSSRVSTSILFASDPDRNRILFVVQFVLVSEDDDEDESVPFRISCLAVPRFGCVPCSGCVPDTNLKSTN